MLWQTLLHGDPLPWLLEKSDPAVRTLTLRQLLDRGPRDVDLRETQQRAMSSPPISTLLKRQRTDGSWPGPNMYGPKYQGTHWSNLLLIEYGADPGDPRVRRAARPRARAWRKVPARCGRTSGGGSAETDVSGV